MFLLSGQLGICSQAVALLSCITIMIIILYCASGHVTLQLCRILCDCSSYTYGAKIIATLHIISPETSTMAV